MIVIAITGNAGSGKSAAISHLQHLGIKSISADMINASLLQHSSYLVTFIEKALDQVFSDADGNLDTSSLRQSAFSSPHSRATLERILHPVILDNIELQLSLLPSNDYCVVEVPLLFEAGWHERFPAILLITSSYQNLSSRLYSRPGIDEQAASSILDNQQPDSQKFKRASDIVLNNGDLAHLHLCLDDLHNTLTKHKDADS